MYIYIINKNITTVSNVHRYNQYEHYPCVKCTYIININITWVSSVCIVDQDIFIDISPGCNVHKYNMVMVSVHFICAACS